MAGQTSNSGSSFNLAQGGPGNVPPPSPVQPNGAKPVLKVDKPAAGSQPSFDANAFSTIDLRAIANDQIVLLRDGRSLKIIFADDAVVTIVDFFYEGAEQPQIQVADQTVLTPQQFAQAFPVTTDPSVLPASGPAGGPAGGNGADVSPDADLAALFGGRRGPLDLLGDTDFTLGQANFELDTDDAPRGGDTTGSIDEASTDESALDRTNQPITIGGNLNINFGRDGFGSVRFDGRVELDAFGGPSVDLTSNARTASGLTSGGSPIAFVMSADGLTISGFATVDGVEKEIFRATLGGSTPTYTFTLFEEIDNLGAVRDLAQVLVFSIDARDRDGDASLAPSRLSINIADDVPEIVSVQEAPAQMFEGDREIGNFRGEPLGLDDDKTDAADNSTAGGQGPDGTPLPPSGASDGLPDDVTVSGSLGIEWGADDDTGYDDAPGDAVARKVEFLPTGTGEVSTPEEPGSDEPDFEESFELPGAKAANSLTNSVGAVLVSQDGSTQQALGALYSNGELIKVWIDPNPLAGVGGELVARLVGYTGELGDNGEPANPVFVVTLDAGTFSGSYNFTLLGPIDHFDGDSSNGVTADPASELQNLILTFGVRATDADGDSVDTQFQIAIRDDKPVVVADGNLANLIVNGSFASGDWGSTSWGSAGVANGWTYSVEGGAENQNLERVDLPYRGVNGADQALDLELSPGNVSISQDVQGVGEGQVYTVSFQAGGDGSASNGLQVLWRGQVIATLTGEQINGDLKTFTYSVIGGAEPNTLTFREIGKSGDFSGTFLANVSLVQSRDAVVDEDGGLEGGNPGGAGDVEAAASVTGQLLISWGSDDGDGADIGRQDGAGINTNESGNALTGRSVFFSSAEIGISGVDGALTSRGQEILTRVVNDGTMLEGYVAGDPERVVFDVSLSDDGTGSYRFTLRDVLDHPTADTEDDISLSFGFTAKDFDGDIATGSFTVTVDDDTPIFFGAEAVSSLDEDGLLFGNPGLPPEGQWPAANDYAGSDVPGSAIQTPWTSLNISWGADNKDAADSRVLGIIARQDGVRLLDQAPNAEMGRALYFTNAEVGVSGVDGALTSRGDEVTFSLIESGTRLVGTAGGRIVMTVALSDDDNGAYRLTLLDELDHFGENSEDDIELTFNVTARDSDGDTATGSFVVLVDDDAPVIGSPNTGNVEEEDQPVAGLGNEDTSGSGDNDFRVFGSLVNLTSDRVSNSLEIDWGADDRDGSGRNDGIGRSVSFSGTTDTDITASAGGSPLGALTANGDLVQFRLSEGNTKLVGYAVNNGVERTIFEATLSDDGSGSYAFRLFDSIDHPEGAGENTLRLTFGFNATDADGDTVRSTFGVNVLDDTPVFTGSVTTRTVDEDGLATGNPGLPASGQWPSPNAYSGSDAAGEARTASASLNISWGGDDGNVAINGGFNGTQVAGDRSVVFTSATVAGLPTLTSNGVTLTYTISGNGTVLTATRGEGGAPVFRVTLSDSDNGTYSFELLDNLDHSQSNAEDNINLDFAFTARDGDGDQLSGTFRVIVDDDAPVLGASQSVSVDEDDLLLGNDPFPKDDLIRTGSLAISWGADDHDDNRLIPANVPNERDVFFTNNVVTATDNGGSPVSLTSDGEAVKIASLLGGRLLVGYTGDNPLFNQVFSVALDDNGAGTYTFKLLGNLDHTAVQGENLINLAFNFTARDSDGDAVNGRFSVVVVDDVVRIGSPASALVDEDGGLPGGNLFGPDDAFLVGTSDGGSLAISWGSDNNDSGATNNRSVAFDAGIQTNGVVSRDGGTLTANGATVRFVRVSNTEILGVADDDNNGVVSAAGRVVFRVTLSDNGSGSYDFQLLDNVDHPVPNTEDNVGLTFGFTATDSDGDTASSQFSVSIDDDTPIVSSNGTARLDEDAFTGGIPGGRSDDNGTSIVTGTLGHSFGADGAGTVKWLTTGLTLQSTFSAGVSQDGTVLTIYQTQNGVDVAVLTATITNPATGAYTVAQVKPINHPQGTIPGTEDNVQFTISYQVTDADGDRSAPGTLTINVDDDMPTVGTNALVQLDEDAFTGGIPGGREGDVTPDLTSFSGTLNHAFGADGAGSVKWLTNGLTLQSTFSAQVSENGALMTIYQTQNGVQVAVVTARITDPATGAYTVTQVAPIKHPQGTIPGTEDNVQFTISYQATDKDGDAAAQPGTLTINVDDDMPVATNGALTLSEATDLGTGSVAAEGTLSLNFGADGANGGVFGSQSIRFNVTALNALGLKTIDGTPVVFSQFQTTLNGNKGGELGSQVLKLEVMADGTYKASLSEALFHADGTPADNALTLNVGYSLVDGDGDHSVQSTITLTIGDDQPAQPSDASLVVDEADFTGSVLTVTGTNVGIDFGADGPLGAGGSLLFDLSAVQALNLQTINGTPVFIRQVGGHVYGTEVNENGATVFDLNLDTATGIYSFKLHQAIQHTDGSGNTVASKVLTFGYILKDADGDTTAPAAITIDLKDGGIADNQAITGTVSEDGITNGAFTGAFGVSTAGTGFGGNVFSGVIDFGRDGYKPGTLALSGTPPLTANGQPVKYATVGNVLYGYTGTTPATGVAPASPVFTLSLDVVTGAFLFTLLKGIDHAIVGETQESTFAVPFNLTFQDGDGSTGSASLIVNVEDGWDGNDTVTGTNAGERLVGGPGVNVLNAGGGDDTLGGDSNTQTTAFNGEGGNDTLETKSPSGTTSVDLVAGTISGGHYGGSTVSGVENVTNKSPNSAVIYRGDENANRLEGGNKDDVLEGRGGNDTIVAGDGDDLIVFNAGLIGPNPGPVIDGVDTISGGSGDDTLRLVTEGNRSMAVQIGGSTTSLEVRGTGPAPLVASATSIETIEIGLNTNVSNELFGSGATGAPRILAAGTSAIDGTQLGLGNGQDRFYAGASTVTDEIDARGGNDFAIYTPVSNATAGSGVQINLGTSAYDDGSVSIAANTAQFRLPSTGATVHTDRLYNFENAEGGGGNDVLVGTSGANSLRGEDGNDTLVGLGGDDNIHGGQGNDTILYAAGDGRDVVDGAAGTDTLIVTGNGADETYRIETAAAFQTRTGAASTGAGEIVMSRDAGVIVDANRIEEISLDTGAGADTIIIDGDFAGTSLATSTIHVDANTGNDTLDLSGLAPNRRVVSSGGDGTDTVRLGVNYAGASYAKIFAEDGTTLIGAEVTIGGVTHELTYYESFTFADGSTRTLPQLFNTAPVAQNQVFVTDEDTFFTGSLLAGASDAEGDSLQVPLGSFNFTSGGYSVSSVSGNGTFTFTPLTNISGSFTGGSYKLTDGQELSNAASITVDIRPVADQANINVAGGAVGTQEGAAVGIPVTIGLGDLDGSETVTKVVLSGLPAGTTFNVGAVDPDNAGRWIINAPTAAQLAGLTMTPAAGYAGAFSLSIAATVLDTAQLSTGLASDEKTFTSQVPVTVTFINDKPDAINDTIGIGVTGEISGDLLRWNDRLDPDPGALNTLTLGPITIPQNSYGITAADVKLVLTGINVTLGAIGTDWQKLAGGEEFKFSFTYTLNGNPDVQGDYDTATVNVTFLGVNDTPVMQNAAPTLATITEDQTNPAGTLVSTILGNTVTDADANAVEGIAIRGVNSGNGTWQYSTDGTTWVNFGSYSASSALLLAADDRVRFVPNGLNGTTASFDYVAWDQTVGTAGQTAEITGGFASPFSTEINTASISVTEVQEGYYLTQQANITSDGQARSFNFSIPSSGLAVVRVTVNGDYDDTSGIFSSNEYADVFVDGDFYGIVGSRSGQNGGTEIARYGNSDDTSWYREFVVNLAAGSHTILVDNVDAVDNFAARDPDWMKVEIFSPQTQTFTGGNGDDVHLGTWSNDVINGGSGNDRLGGGFGSDRLTGSGGSDTFVFNANDLFSGSDTITDFNRNEDTLDLSGLLDAAFASDPAAQSGASNFVQIVRNGNESASLFVDKDGSANGADFYLVAKLEGNYQAGQTISTILDEQQHRAMISVAAA